MPNWVYNNVSVSGKREDLIAFANKASQTHETQWLSEEWVANEDGTNTRIPAEERTIEIEMSDAQPLSFWNFVRPTDEELPYYFGNLIKEEDKDDPNATSEERLAKSLTFSGSGWYDWNIRNWGTKWDANDENGDTPDLDDLKDHDSISYSFSTAWSIPEPIFRAMVAQHPELDFEFHSEEEQGWGAEFSTYDSEDEDGKPIKELNLVREWDIPSSHADYVERDNEDGCVCAWNDDPEDLYDDCPTAEKDFYVVVTKTYRVSASNAENAYNLATDNDPDEFMELIEDETLISIKDENGERLYPTLDGEPTEKACNHRFVPVYTADDNGEGSVYSGLLSCVFCNEERASETAEIVTEVNE
jgi:hypothetical protein